MPSGGLSRPALLSEHPTRGIQNRARNDSTLFSRRNCIFTTLTLRENKIRWSFWELFSTTRLLVSLPGKQRLSMKAKPWLVKLSPKRWSLKRPVKSFITVNSTGTGYPLVLLALANRVLFQAAQIGRPPLEIMATRIRTCHCPAPAGRQHELYHRLGNSRR